MATEITLNALVEKVKTDLFLPYADTKQEGKIAYPIFFVEEVELELAVNIMSDVNAGIKVTIPQLIEGSLGADEKASSGHTLKLKLTPILTRQELRNLMDEDERLMKGVQEASLLALRRGARLAGED
jgi:hypothetical protein